MKKFLIILLFLFSSLSAQDRSKTFGLVLMEDFSSQSLNYGFSYWVANHLSLELIGGFEKIKLEDMSGSLLNLGTGVIYHFGNKALTPFLGFRFLYSNLSDDESSYEDFIYGPIFGAEYFFSPNVSLATEFQFTIINAADKYSATGNTPGATTYKTCRYIILRLYL